MGEKLFHFLDTFPAVCAIWVNSELEYTTGPCAGYEKISRDEALERCAAEPAKEPVKKTKVDTTKK